MFHWKKRGQIWRPDPSHEWIKEYGQNPNAVVLSDRIRIYFSSRKRSESAGGYISYIFFVDVDRSDPSRIIAEHHEPLLNNGGKGTEGAFDEFGTMPGSVLWLQDRQEMWLYYVGWSRGSSFPYKWANGLAISKDGGVSFEKCGQEPIMSPCEQSPPLQACPRVFHFGGNKWSMWYAAGLEWYSHNGRMNPIYVIKSATSGDGLHWNLAKEQTIPSVRNKECQSSPTVIRHNGRYCMFFSYRDVLPDRPEHAQYRVGCAWSDDFVHWHRDDPEAGIDVSPSGWDSQAVCYPHVVNVDDKVYMFYSGNQYGCSGFGYAELAA